MVNRIVRNKLMQRFGSLILKALKRRNVGSMKLLLKDNLHPISEFSWNYNWSFLHINAIYGNSVITQLLIQAGCQLNIVESISGETALHFAIVHANFDVASELIRSGADVRVANQCGNTPLQLAVVNTSNVNLLKEVVRPKCTRPLTNNQKYLLESLKFAVKDVREEKLVRERIARGRNCRVELSLVKMLMDAGANVNHKDANDCSPIQTAVYTGNLELVKILIDAGADVNNQNKIGATALHDAVLCCNQAMIHLLLSNGASVATKTVKGDTALHWASMLNYLNSHAAIIKMLLEFGSDVNEPNEMGRTAFHLATKYGDLTTVEQCISEYNADVKLTDKTGCSVLHHAVFNKNKDVMDRLLEIGFPIDIRTNSGLTPLLYASYQCQPYYVQRFLERGADIKAEDKQRRTALCLSMGKAFKYAEVYQKYRPEIYQDMKYVWIQLLENGSDVNQKVFKNRDTTTLEMAIYENQYIDASLMIIEYTVWIETATNKPVFDAYNLAVIREATTIKHYYDACLAELTDMRYRKIEGTLITYLSILTEPLKVVAGYARNEDLVKALEASGYEIAYPIYAPQLRGKFAAAFQKQWIMEKACTALSNTLQFADPTDVAIETIFKYLNKESVKLLIDNACSQ